MVEPHADPDVRSDAECAELKNAALGKADVHSDAECAELKNAALGSLSTYVTVTYLKTYI
jgi:hypothetical protein